jgi:hypothetical protein
MESYRTITGSSTQDVVDPADGQLYHRGHVYGKAEDDSGPVTIGYSSASKVWSNHNIQLPELLRWCRTLADKFDSEQDVTTQSGLDYLTVGEEIEELPDGVIAADWYVSAYKTPMTLRYKDGNGCNVTCDLLDVNLEIDRPLTNKTQIGIVIRGPGLDWPVLFSLTSDVYFRPTPDNEQELILQKGQDSIPLLQYLNGNPLHFYFADFSQLRGSEWFRMGVKHLNPLDQNLIIPIDWAAHNVIITREYTEPAHHNDGRLSIHDFLFSYLDTPDHQAVVYDHRTGEVADFLAFQETATEINIKLYHCKKSETDVPGDRFNDVSEVCSQVVKSIFWFRRHEALWEKIKRRLASRSTFVKGDLHALEAIFTGMLTKRVHYQIVLVQPGISRQKLSRENALILAAAHHYVKSAQGEQLLVWASA